MYCSYWRVEMSTLGVLDIEIGAGSISSIAVARIDHMRPAGIVINIRTSSWLRRLFFRLGLLRNREWISGWT